MKKLSRYICLHVYIYYSDSFDTDDDNNIHVCGVVQNSIADAIY